MNLRNVMIFGTLAVHNKLHNSTNETVLTL